MSPSQYNLLQHLYDKGRDSGLTVGELANWLICTPATPPAWCSGSNSKGWWICTVTSRTAAWSGSA
ncbi:hypothetical protein [Candidatus Amarobacter glycogenicus]|uniref:hypothetical protein n=1 Tax=Candidatus Amarobacter glycogenicus TaxID=3140699 RepID=UPI002A172494|nr:hypothetical protein [Dehalococcoidia bacterium]